jgi:hypothetical protein
MERVSPETLNDQFSMKLYSIIIKAFAQDTSLRTVFDLTDEGEVQRTISHLMLVEMGITHDAELELRHTIRRLSIKALKSRFRNIKYKQKDIRDPQAMKQLQEELMGITAQLQELDDGWRTNRTQ